MSLRWLDPTDPHGPGLSIWTGVCLGVCLAVLAGLAIAVARG